MSRISPREEKLFAEALAQPPAKRGGFLAGACGADFDLLARLIALIEAHEGSGSMLEPVPAIGRNVPAEEKTGDLIGRYKLLQKIGEGGCGVVWMAEQEEPVRRRVALKVIKLGMDTKAVVARFEAERQALAMMDHPNIAKVHDAGATETGRPFFVMELVRGIPITKYCDENKLTPTARLELFIKVCQAVQHAHQKGIIHRDLKPSNILVTVNDGAPTPKVIDFGIAKATQGRLTDATVFTQFEQFIGTPVYMSPEQAEMSSLDIDTRSDIYSLGVLLYELLTGQPPFDPKKFAQAGVDQIRQQIREVEPPWPSARLRTLTDEEQTTIARLRATAPSQLSLILRGDLDWIVMRCIEKDRTRRYDTANGLAMDIQRYLRHEPVIARPPSTGYLVRKLIRRHRVGFAATLAIFGAVTIGAVISTWQAFRATRAEREQFVLREAAQHAQASEAELRRAEAELRVRAEAQELVARHRTYAADMQLAQQALAVDNLVRAQELLDRHRPAPGQRDLRGWEWRYLWQLSRPDYIVQLAETSGSIRSLSLSADGRWLAVAHVGALRIYNVATRQGNLVPSIRAAGRVAIAPAGSLLAASAVGRSEGSPLTGHRIVLWNMQTSEIVKEIATGGPCAGIFFSADAQTLVAATQPPENKITVWRVSDGAILRQFDAPQFDDERHGTTFAVTPDLSLAAHAMPGRQLRVIDLNSGQEVWKAEGADRGSRVLSLAFSPDGSVLASGAGLADSSLRLWDAASGKMIRRLDGHRRFVFALQFAADGRTLASASGDLTIRIWAVASGNVLNTLRGHKLEVWRLAFLTDTTLISGGKDGFVYLWETASRGNDPAALQVPNVIAEWRIATDNQSMLTVDYDGHVARYRGRGFSEKESVMELGAIGPMSALPENRVHPEQISPNLRFIAVQRNDAEDQVEVWDTVTARFRHGFRAARNTFPVAVFLDDRTLRVIAERDAAAKTVLCREWDVASGRELRSWRMSTPASGIIRITFFPDGRRCLVTGSSGSVLHDLHTGTEETIPFVAPDSRRRSPQFSPDGKHVATSLMGRHVAKLWETSSFREVATLSSTMSVPHSVAFSPDGRRLAIGDGNEEAVTLWDVHSHEPLLTLEGSGTTFLRTAFSPDGNILASRSTLLSESGGILHLWRAPTWEEIGAAERAQVASARPQ